MGEVTVIRVLTTLVAAVLGAMAGRYVSWAIRSWPGHESLEHDYLGCWKCPGGIRRRCANAGLLQDRVCLVISTLLAGFSIWYFGPTTKGLLAWVFGISCWIITVVDIRYLIIPDTLSVKGAYAGLIYALGAWAWTSAGMAPPAHYVPLTDSLIGFLIGGGFLWVLGWLAWVFLKKEGMGGGDVKLLAAIGAWMGWKPVIATVVIASLFGSVGGLTGILYARIKYRKAYKPLTHLIPFGPYLCLGFLIVFFAGMEPLFTVLDLYQRWVERTFMQVP